VNDYETAVLGLWLRIQNESAMDENGVAAAIIPIATTFCRVTIIPFFSPLGKPPTGLYISTLCRCLFGHHLILWL